MTPVKTHEDEILLSSHPPCEQEFPNNPSHALLLTNSRNLKSLQVLQPEHATEPDVEFHGPIMAYGYSGHEDYSAVSPFFGEPIPAVPQTTQPLHHEGREVQIDALNVEMRNLEHLNIITEHKLSKKIDDVFKRLDSFALKGCRRKRTFANRCQALNRKGESCNGYICKEKSKHLCYAHYVIVNQKIEQSGYLYKSKE